MIAGGYDKLVNASNIVEIIDVINAKNTSQIFMKDFDFKDLLGNIRYNQSGHIIGEEMRSPGLVITLIQELAWWR